MATAPSAKNLRHDTIGASLVDRQGKPTNLYRKCPHCGMVDHNYSVQGLKNSHFQITRVGSLLKYECGKCRKQFHAFEVCVPANTDPYAFYQKISNILNDAPNPGGTK